MVRTLRLLSLLAILLASLPPAPLHAQESGTTLLPVIVQGASADPTVDAAALESRTNLLPIVFADNDGGVSPGGTDEPAPIQTPDPLPSKTFELLPNQAMSEQHDEMMVEFVTASVTETTSIVIQPLRSLEIPPLDAGLINVTKRPRFGYDVQLHKVFEEIFRTSLPYDAGLLPSGYSAQDIETFYYDEAAGFWRPLERLEIDDHLGQIHSRAKQGAVFINAIRIEPISTSTTLDENPTDFEGMTFANPGENIQLIAPPQLEDNLGNAYLHYPIDLPPGRGGMMPDLAIEYDSSHANGWLGVGWNVSAPEIRVETRWGAPRYQTDAESPTLSETYLLNDELLTPMSHRTGSSAETEEDPLATRFYRRVENEFEQIVRCGTAPDNYWWRITDKAGTVSVFGDPSEATTDDGLCAPLSAADNSRSHLLATGTTDATAIAEAESITANAGNIFKWMLNETSDRHGNGIDYSYAHVQDSGVGDGQGGVTGHQIYLESINYTTFGSTAGPYTVTFALNDGQDIETRRPDVMIDGRGGFKQVTSALLQRIIVEMSDGGGETTPIRAYDLVYETGPFGKTLLQAIVQKGANGLEFHRHEFEYHNDLQQSESTYNGFQAEQPWETGEGTSTETDATDILPDYKDPTALSGVQSNSDGGSFYGGYNAVDPTKVHSYGAKLGYNHGDSKTLLAMIDINGDDLPDKVFQGEDGVSVQLQTPGADEDNAFGPITLVASLNDRLPSEVFDTFSYGGEIYDSTPLSSTGDPINGIVNNAFNFSTGNTYFADVNYDGLPDVVQDGSVWFNHVEFDEAQSNYVPTFTQSSADTPVAVNAGSVDATVLDRSILDTATAEAAKASPHLDAVRVWTAPYPGTIRILGPVRLLAPEDGIRGNPDGVHVSIQHNATALWQREISADENGGILPEGVNEITIEEPGERIYFRVHSGEDGTQDQIQWDPIIEYVDSDLNEQDVNELAEYRYQASSDFSFGVRSDLDVRMPLDGKVQITGSFTKTAATTDDVKIVVKRVLNQVDLGTPLEQEVTRDTKDPVDVNETIFDVKEGDLLRLRVEVDSPIDVSALQWEPVLTYIESDDATVADADGNSVITMALPYAIDMYPQIDYSQANATLIETLLPQYSPPADGPPDDAGDLSKPQVGWEAEAGAWLVVPMIDPVDDLAGTFTIKNKANGKQIYKAEITPAGIVVPHLLIIPSEDIGAGNELMFDFSFPMLYSEDAAMAIRSSVLLATNLPIFPPIPPPATPPTGFTIGHGRHWAVETQLFGQDYRGWQYAVYDGSTGGDVPIDEAKLILAPSEADAVTDPQAVANLAAYALYPDAVKNRWAGPDKEVWIGPDSMSSSRFGGYLDIPTQDDLLPAEDAAGMHPAVNKISVSQQTILGGNEDEDSASLAGNPALSIPDWEADTASAALQSMLGWELPYPINEFDPAYTANLLDYLDLNGDGYPDVVGSALVQYTDPFGALLPQPAAPPNYNDTISYARQTDNVVWNAGQGGNPALSMGNADGYSNSAGSGGTPSHQNVASPPTIDNNGSQLAHIDPEADGAQVAQASLGAGLSIVESELLDINGDGLPDKLYNEKTPDGNNLLVSLNLGYGFAPKEPWGDVAISTGRNENYAWDPLLGVNSDNYGFAMGSANTRNQSISVETLIDMNGDGLLDSILPNEETGSISVRFNTGNGFTDSIVWTGALEGVCDVGDLPDLALNLLEAEIEWGNAKICNAMSQNEDGMFLSVPIPLAGAGYTIINPGTDHRDGMARQEATLRDVNGDGYVDHVASSDATSINVALNNTGKTNLIKTIKRPLGATITLDYARTGNTYEQPDSHWVMSQVAVNDGYIGDGVDDQITTYRYLDGYYDRLERDFYGFRTVVEEDREITATTDDMTSDGPLTTTLPPISGEEVEELSVYRSVVRQFLNDTFYSQGLLEEETHFIGASGGVTDTVTTNTHEFASVWSDPLPPAVADVRDGEGTASLTDSIFPQLVQTTKNYFDAETPSSDAVKQEILQQTFDEHGNITMLFDSGESGQADDVRTEIHYSSEKPACVANGILNVPLTVTVAIPDLDVEFERELESRRRHFTIDCGNGDIGQMSQHLFFNSGSDSDIERDEANVATTEYEYNPTGTISKIIYPVNKHGERYWLEYTYDDVIQNHITLIEDSFRYESTAEYDLRFGQISLSTDINSNDTIFSYDQFGRLDYVVGPYQSGTEDKTLDFDYEQDKWPAVARVKHIDSHRGNDTIDTILFTDGLGRVIQTKKDATIHRNAHDPNEPFTLDAMIVSGRVQYDFAGRPNKAYYPTLEALDRSEDSVNMDFSAKYDAVSPTETSYDTRDRVTSVTLPDSTVISTTYGFGEHKGQQHFVTTVMDRNGHQSSTYRNIRGLVTRVEEEQDIGTDYGYDPLNQLTVITDTLSNVTEIRYDNFGRRTNIDNLDAGETRFEYDPASNLSEKTTADLRGTDEQRIEYSYEYNRLARISYPYYTENDVIYTYGSPGVAYNQAGRIVEISSEAGDEERFYGPLGEIIREVRNIDSDFHFDDNSYETQFEYDTWGRVHKLTFDDSEQLTYEYDASGLPRKITGEKIRDQQEPYLNRLEYNKFGQRVFMELGNGSRTSYAYDPATRRLATLQAADRNRKLFQDMRYGYDNVGNITSVQNVSQQIEPIPGGPSHQSFTYDALDRLVNAAGWFTTTHTTQSYTLEMAYDKIHNITHKNQLHSMMRNGIPWARPFTSYDWSYHYDSTQPHNPSHIGHRAFEYDDNGNQTNWIDEATARSRSIEWDEENRIQRILDVDPNHVINDHSHPHYHDGFDHNHNPVGTGDSAHAEISVRMRHQMLPSEEGTSSYQYDLEVWNSGDELLHAVQVMDNLAIELSKVPLWNLDNVVISSGLTRNPNYNGGSDKNLLAGIDQLDPGQREEINILVTVDWGRNEPTGATVPSFVIDNIAQAEARGPANQLVQDSVSLSLRIPDVPTSLTTASEPVLQGASVEGNQDVGTVPLHEEGEAITFKYDDVGERALMQTPHGEVAFINPFYVVRNPDIRTKHIYVGNTLISSVLFNIHEDDDLVQAAAISESELSAAEQTAKESAPEHVLQERFFYHPDHVGTSLYVTDQDGEVYQHLEYFPSGEIWVEELVDDQSTPYRFSGNEMDHDAQLTYLGERYYDPQTSLWQSADWLLPSYLLGTPNRGAFDSANLALFTYRYNNPVQYADPDGPMSIVAEGCMSAYQSCARVHTHTQFSDGPSSVVPSGGEGIYLIPDLSDVGITQYEHRSLYEYVPSIPLSQGYCNPLIDDCREREGLSKKYEDEVDPPGVHPDRRETHPPIVGPTYVVPNPIHYHRLPRPY